MPEIKLTTPADRVQGELDNMHPRLDGDLINTPDDLMEGVGNFVDFGADGQPEGFELVAPEQIKQRKLYLGADPDKVTEHVVLPVSQGLYVLNTLVASGDDPPEQFVTSSLPKPEAPRIVLGKAEVAGYPASTLEHPYWLSYAWRRGSVFTEWARGVLLPPLEQGESIRLVIPDSAPAGVNGIVIGLTPPGQSTASNPAQYRVQAVFDLPQYLGSTQELNGPYHHDIATPGNTSLNPPGRVSAQFATRRTFSQPGVFRFAVTAVNELGESLPGPMAGPIDIVANAYWGEDDPAGYGNMIVTRGSLPPGAWGWHLYAQFNGKWNRVYNSISGEGLSKPFPTNLRQITFGGFDSGSFYAKFETYLLNSAELPVENTSGVEPPTTALDTPVIFGAARPKGRLYARVSELTDSEESPLSDAAEADIGEEDIAQIVFANKANQLANATFVLEGADGIPISYTVSGSGTVTTDDGELIIKPTGALEVASDALKIDRDKQWAVGALLRIEDPETGTFGGTFEAALRQIGTTTTDTTLKSVNAKGEHRYYETISPAGYNAAPEWKPDVVQAQLVYKCSSSGAGMAIRVSRQILADYAYGFRRAEEIAGPLVNPNPGAAQTSSPTGTATVGPSPTPEDSPEALVQTPPDRPLVSEGAVIESVDFEPGMPAGWAQTSLNATLAREAGAALSGSWGLASRKTVGGSSAFAALSKEFVAGPLEHRNALGLAATQRVPTLPSNGSITLRELRRKDGTRFAWVDLDTKAEVSELEITKAATASGNITTTIDEGGTPTPRATAIVATKEKATLTITSMPVASAPIKVGFGDNTASVPVYLGQSAQIAIKTLEVTRGALKTGIIDFLVGSPYPNPRGLSASGLSATVTAGDSPEIVAQKLRNDAAKSTWQYDLWHVSGSGRFVTLTAKITGPTYPGMDALYHNASVGGGDTGVRGTITDTRPGLAAITPDTPETIATRIRQTNFPGVKTGATTSTTQVTLEALEPGAKADVTYDPGTTGVTADVVIDTQGSQDTLAEIAQKVVDTYTSNTFVTATRSDATVTFTHTSTGVKADATFSAGSTGVRGTMRVATQGGNDIVAYAIDSLGGTRQRRILDAITSTTLITLDMAVSGAGRDDAGESRAVLQVWGAKNTDPLELRAIFEELDLSDYDAAVAAIGVMDESSSALTWEVYTDDIVVTESGGAYYRYHSSAGRLLGQVHNFLAPGYLPQDGLLLQGWRQAVLPGFEYTASVFARRAGLKYAAEPFYMYCVTPEGDVKPIGCITEIEGPGLPDVPDEGEVPTNTIQGTGDWQEYTRTFVVPDGCYELRMESRNIGEGEIVFQELVISEGALAKRTNLYAATGSYVATLPMRQAYYHSLNGAFPERKVLIVDVDAPQGTSAIVSYQAADAEGGPYDAAVSDPALLAQKGYLRTNISAFSDGIHPVVVRSGSPSVEYAIQMHSLGGRPMATFLMPDRTEFEGGAFFGLFDRYAEPPDVNTTRLVGGRLSNQPLSEPVGDLPELELYVFTPGAKKYIEDRAQLVDFCIEARGQILTVALRGPVRFEPQMQEKKVDGVWRGLWKAKVPGAWVKEVQDLPT